MNFSQSETDFIKDAEAYVPIDESLKPVIESADELKKLLEERRAAAAVSGGMPDLMHTKFIGLDLAGWDMTDLNLRRTTFDGCNLNCIIAIPLYSLRCIILRNCVSRHAFVRFMAHLLSRRR